MDPATGRVLATSCDRIKHELIARISEFNFGHVFVPGKHSEAVLRGLRKRDLHCIADRLQQSLNPSFAVPAEAFTHSKHQEAKRFGLDLPALKRVVKLAVNDAGTREQILKPLADAGLEVNAGDKAEVWIVVNMADGVVFGALHRLAGQQKSVINTTMKNTGPSKADSIKNEVGSPSPEPAPSQDFLQTVALLPDTGGAGIPNRIADMERIATLELERPIPGFGPTSGMRDGKDARRRASHELSAVIARRSDVQMQIAKFPPVRWWSRITGSAKRRKLRIAELEILHDEIEEEGRRKEFAITIAHRRELREEKAAKGAHSKCGNRNS